MVRRAATSAGRGHDFGAGSLGYARLHLQRPRGMDCLPRPYSHIGLVGSFTTSPGHQPVPGSDGDMCAKTASGALVFRSCEFTDRSGVAFKIEIDRLRFRDARRSLYFAATARRGCGSVVCSTGREWSRRGLPVEGG